VISYFYINDGKERHYGLDLLRFIAIGSVILYHFPRNENDLFLRAVSHYGYLGVDIFFVLSGFLIGGQTFSQLKRGKGFDIKTFCIKRFYRTFPNYYFILLVHAVLVGFEGYDWRFLVFLQNIGGLYSFTHSWSLCVEEHFYVLFPILVIFLIKTKRLNHYLGFVAVLLLLTIVSRYLIWTEHRPDLIYREDVPGGFDIYFKELFYPTYTRLDGIAVGTGLAYIKNYKNNLWQTMTSKTNLFLFISVALFLCVAAFSWTKVDFFASVFSFSGYALSFGALLVSVISEKSLVNRFKIPFVKNISILSFSLYLTHSFAISFLIKLTEAIGLKVGFWPTWLLAFPVSLLFSYILFLSIEKPFLLLRSRRLDQRRE